jgi:hypothetical protein
MKNGGIIGPKNNASLSGTSGVWSLSSQYTSNKSRSWDLTSTPPNIVISGLQMYLDGQGYPGTGNIWKDHSGSNINSTLTSVSYTTDRGGGLVFGSGSRTNFPSGLNFSGGGFTISVWLKHTGVVSTARTQRYFTLGSSPSEGPVLRHNSASAASLHGYLFDSGNTFRSLDIANQVFTDTYYNFVYTYNGSIFRLYRNNVEVGALSATVSQGAASGGAIASSGTEFFEGNMYVVQYYNRGLSTEELTQNYNAFRVRFDL